MRFRAEALHFQASTPGRESETRVQGIMPTTCPRRVHR